MMRQLLQIVRRQRHGGDHLQRSSLGLQLILWTLWTLSVCITAAVTWYLARAAHRPVDTLGMAIHCILVGTIGLVGITLVEMRVQPWRFYE